MIHGPAVPGGFSVFCDDIRREDNGKELYLGVYTGAMVFPADSEFPLHLTSIAISVTYWEAPHSSEEPVTIKVFLPGEHEEAAAEAMVLPAGPRPDGPTFHATDRPEDEASDLLMRLKATIRISPVELKQVGEIRVRAFVGEHKVKLGSLSVMVAQDHS